MTYMTADDQQMVAASYAELRRLNQAYRRARDEHRWDDANRISCDIADIEQELGLQ